jgi:hypothetical protein
VHSTLLKQRKNVGFLAKKQAHFLCHFFLHEMKYDINKNKVYFLFFQKFVFFSKIYYNRIGCYNFTDYSSEENI